MKKMKLFRRILKTLFGIIVLAVVLLVIADVILYLWLRNNPDKVAEYIRTYTGSKAEVGSISGEVFFGFAVRDVVIFPSDNPKDQRLLRAANIDIDMSLRSLLKLRPTPSEVRLDDFDVFFTIDEKGKFILPSFSPYAAQGGEASGPLDLPTDIDLTLTRGSIYFNWHVAVPPVQAEILRVEATGAVDRKGVVIIDSFAGHPGFASKPINAAGRIDPFDEKAMDIRISGGGINLLDFSEIFHPLVPDAPAEMLPRGVATCDVSFHGPFNTVGVDGTISLSAGRLINLQLNSAELTFAYDEGSLTLSDCVAKAYGGAINLDAAVHFSEPRPAFTFDMSFAGVDVNTYIEQIGLYFQETAGDFQGHFEGFGELDSPDSFVAKGNFVSMGGTYRSPYISRYATAVERLSYKALRVDFEVGSGTISIVDLLLEGEDLCAVARGTIGFNNDLSLKGQMQFPRERAMAIPELSRWMSYIPRSTKKIVLDFTLRGDLIKPKFKASPPVKVLDVFCDGETGLLEWFSGVADDYFGGQE